MQILLASLTVQGRSGHQDEHNNHDSGTRPSRQVVAEAPSASGRRINGGVRSSTHTRETREGGEALQTIRSVQASLWPQTRDRAETRPTVWNSAPDVHRYGQSLVMTVAWLLDANVVSEMMRPRPNQRVVGFLDQIADDGIGLASITVWEILNGIGRLNPGRRRNELFNRLEDLLDDLFEEQVFDWTLEDARTCAGIMEHKRRREEPLDDHLADAFLAAMAVRLGSTVVTRNVGEFRNTGAEVVDPWISGGTIDVPG